MVQGMSIETFTLVYVLISLVGIASGTIVMYGFLTNRRFNRWTTVFLFTTVLTNLTGFLFPFMGVTHAIKLGIISRVLLILFIVLTTFAGKRFRTAQ